MTQRILAVEDEKDLVDLLSYNLSREGYWVDIAATGNAALERIRPPGHPALLRARDDLACDCAGTGDVARGMQILAAALDEASEHECEDSSVVTHLMLDYGQLAQKSRNLVVARQMLEAALERVLAETAPDQEDLDTIWTALAQLETVLGVAGGHRGLL